ncbi:radical SAM/SPASM domain-containing protein [Anaerophilus nitritogenes]|uniref:radical SAM/SPASM domain-containing protein n=1 Tax=Anaerophilus nitritogenes TaxID=2498136 RepID=UPI00101CCEC7|nr:radical SAM protein [Anaerophilus nitritogenes]
MIISWNTTKRCNLYCDHCYRDASNEYFSDELNTYEGKKLIEEISKAGFKILILSGGEPLMRKDLCEISHHATKCGLIPVLGTNGTLISKDKAYELKKSGIQAAAISIDNIDEKKHDDFRKVKGSFQKAIEGIKNCIEAGIRVQINTTVTKNNKNEIIKIINWAQEMGSSSCHPFFLVKVGRGKNIQDQALDEKEYIRLVHKIIDHQLNVDIELKPTCAPQFMSFAKSKNIKMRFSRGCIAGIGYCCILPNGEVHVCPYLPMLAGDVKKTPFHVIWKKSSVFQRLREKENYKGSCRNCDHFSICGGCRARAYEETGDYMMGDPLGKYCFVREEIK